MAKNTGLGRFGEDTVPAGGGQDGARGRAYGQDERVLWGERVHARGTVLQEKVSTQSLPAQVAGQGIIRDRFGDPRLRGEIHAEQPVVEATHLCLLPQRGDRSALRWPMSNLPAPARPAGSSWSL